MTRMKQRSYNIGDSEGLHAHEVSLRDILSVLADHLELNAAILREVAESVEDEGDIPPRSHRSRR